MKKTNKPAAGKRFRYPGVQPFSTTQRDLFRGRAEDTERLLSLISQEKLCVLFGKSGYGKSSLLNAGIIPALQMESEKGKRRYLPVSVRFYSATHKNDNLFTKFRASLNNVISPFLEPLVLENPGIQLPDTLWGDYKRWNVPHDTTLVLLFDQFEEFFSYPAEQQQLFKTQLSELIYADYPQFVEDNEDKLSPGDTLLLEARTDVRVVLSIRKDRLADLDRLKDKLPAILHKRVELLPLNKVQASAALTEPAMLEGKFESPRFHWSRMATDNIIHALSRNKDGVEVGVEAFQLQILAEYIERKIIQKEIQDTNGDGLPDVGPADLPPDLRNVYGEYYRRKIFELPEGRQIAAREVIEEDLVDGENEEQSHRLSIDGAKLMSRKGVDLILLDELVDSFLLRREINTTGGYNYELSHDTLLKPVLEWRDERRAENERLLIEQNAREKEARAAEIRQMEESERLKNEAIDASKRARRNKNMAYLLALLAMAAMVIALLQRGEAKKQGMEAEKQTKIARDNETQAIANAELAESYRRDAVTEADNANIEKERAKDQARKAQYEEQRATDIANKNKRLVDSLFSINGLLEESKSLLQQNTLELSGTLQKQLEKDLKDIGNLIYQLDYKNGWENIKIAAERLDVMSFNKNEASEILKNKAGKILLEFVFIYAYSNETVNARDALIRFSNLKEPSLPINSIALTGREPILQAVKNLNPLYFDSLELRYFPKMIKIERGVDTLFPEGAENAKNPPKKYEIKKDFKIAETEITWWQYNLFCSLVKKDDTPKRPAWGYKGDNPVVNISWDEGQKYVNWLNEIKNEKKGYNLPTEAEWQLAARSGSNYYKFAGNNNIDLVAWYSGNSKKSTHPVRTRQHNGKNGLFDMNGNVYEWCYFGEERNNKELTYRGGSWNSDDTKCEVKTRLQKPIKHGLPKNDIGFRVVLITN